MRGQVFHIHVGRHPLDGGGDEGAAVVQGAAMSKNIFFTGVARGREVGVAFHRLHFASVHVSVVREWRVDDHGISEAGAAVIGGG